MSFVRVCEDQGDSPTEVPIEEDGTVLLTTLNGIFPKATGLKYIAEESGCSRGVRLSDDRLHPPPDGWNHLYYCVFPKSTPGARDSSTAVKRKNDDEQGLSLPKTTKVENKKCGDLIVLNIPWKVDESILRDYFSRFGELVMVQVVDVFIPKPFRSFAFVTFDDPEVSAELIGTEQYIDGCPVTIGAAVPKPSNTERRPGPYDNQSYMQQQMYYYGGWPYPQQQDNMGWSSRSSTQMMHGYSSAYPDSMTPGYYDMQSNGSNRQMGTQNGRNYPNGSGVGRMYY